MSRDFSLEKLDKNICQHVALRLNLGVLKMSAGFVGRGGAASSPLLPSPLATALNNVINYSLSNAYFCPVSVINVGDLE